MKHGLLFFLAFTVLASALPQSSAPPAKPAAKKAAPKTAAAAKKTTASKKGKSTRKPATVSSLRNRQLAPTPDRYKEIQQALVDKGYLKSEPTGVWDADSAAAMTQFQNDQKLSPTGKLSAASLIALGLGPKTAPVPPAGGGAVSGEPVTSPTPASPAASSSVTSSPANRPEN